MWVEKSPREGDTVKITWASWYAELIGQQTTIGVLLPGGGDRWVIDVGDRHVWITTNSPIEVFDQKHKLK